MDNVTHALIGVLLARAALPWVGSLRGALWAAVLASEAPDLDILLNPFFEDARLGYLVHHRGHTHTIVGALVLALGCAGFARWRDRAARPGPLVGLAVGAALIHITADAWNNYGVHPFWPVDASWRYGDMIFILEPLLWLALLPLAFATATRRGVRIGLGAVGVAMAGAVTFALGPLAAAAWTLGVGALGALQLRWDRLWVPTVLSVAVLVGFGAASRTVEAGVRSRMATLRPDETVLDVALTPRPATPWCWQGFVVSHDTTTYEARGVAVSLAPALTSPAACVLRRGEGRTAPLVPGDLPSDPTVAWGERFAAPVGELAALATEQCRVDAFLHFARVPYWEDDGALIRVGDLRYDMEPGLGFAEVETRRTTPADTRGCDDLPPWRSAVVDALLAVPAGRALAR
ncbi:MAG: metal-dependent hydrolase, partial [Pseudomonadota bacterium]|nr:metal-dependent hydrolase [Pseudomonadota bacterium]